jgi:hypothetical protein
MKLLLKSSNYILVFENSFEETRRRKHKMLIVVLIEFTKRSYGTLIELRFRYATHEMSLRDVCASFDLMIFKPWFVLMNQNDSLGKIKKTRQDAFTSRHPSCVLSW